jgi:hypothetical protein
LFLQLLDAVGKPASEGWNAVGAVA